MLGFLVGFRKFTIMVVFLLVMVTFRILNYIDGAQFAENLQIAVVAFFGTNLGEHLINIGKEWVQGKISEITKEDKKGD